MVCTDDEDICLSRPKTKHIIKILSKGFLYMVDPLRRRITLNKTKGYFESDIGPYLGNDLGNKFYVIVKCKLCNTNSYVIVQFKIKDWQVFLNY